MYKLIYGVGASFCAILSESFVSAHPHAMLQHPMDLLGLDCGVAMTFYCAWQYTNNGRGITKWLAARREKKP